MKKLATLLLAAGMIFGVSTGANAIDFKAHGQWIMSFDYGQNGRFTGDNGSTGYNGRGNGGSEDEFEARQRVRLQLDAVASEALSGTVYFELGDQIWGRADQGGALGADGNNVVEVRRAYIDWMIPQTDIKVRMGLQGLALPSFTQGSQIIDDDVAAVVANFKFNDNVSLTAFWARPYNDNGGWTNNHGTTYNNYMDNVDMFALVLPLTFDGVKVTPWAMYAALGPGAVDGNIGGVSAGWYRRGMYPVGGALHKDGNPDGRVNTRYGDAWWAGLTGEVTAFDPLRIAWDINYGSVSYERSRADRHGWFASLLAEYKLDWGIPGIYGWYSSGDDGNPANGSERMPVIHANGNNGFSNFAFNGNPYIARESTLSKSMIGTWGIGARLKDMSFLENLKHTLRVNFIGGTNSTTMTRYLGRNDDFVDAYNGANAAGAFGMPNLYMTTNDYAMEFGLFSQYKMYDNFTIALDMNYIATWIDHSNKVWGRTAFNRDDDTVKDPWNINLSFVYEF